MILDNVVTYEGPAYQSTKPVPDVVIIGHGMGKKYERRSFHFKDRNAARVMRNILKEQ